MQPYKVWLFSDLLEKNKRVFKVPVYQRNYDWNNIQRVYLEPQIILPLQIIEQIIWVIHCTNGTELKNCSLMA